VSAVVERAANPFGNAPVVAAPTGASGQALIMREAQEIQASMMVARNYPRDMMKAADRILNAFTRPSLCEDAKYQYSRGGTDVQGLSIRAAEVLAQNWGNISCGVAELTRAGGQSECLAYAVDLETGFRDEKRFFVRHWRDTKKGGHPVTDERDIYEVVANMGARRKRACILAVIPSDVQEQAERQIDETLSANVQITPEMIKTIAAKWLELGVTKEMLEKRLQRRIESILPAQVLTLRRIYNSLKDGMSTIEEWFEVAPVVAEIPAEDTKPRDVTTKTDTVKEQLRTRGAKTPPGEGRLPMFDGVSAIKELKKAATLEALEKSWVEISRDFVDTGRLVPDEVDSFYQTQRETFGEREGRES
jgi:hypothetical protein